MTRTIPVATILSLLTTFGFGCAMEPYEEVADGEFFEGVQYDAENPNAFVGGGKEDGASYEVPTDLPALANPEIIVSLDGLTVHLFDRETGFSEVYPVGVGVLNSDGVSITPTGHFATGPDTSNSWWYIARRTQPTYFGGFPFIRLTAENSRNQNTYGLHGPITDVLDRGYVSHGCARMAGEDVVRLFYLIRRHASTPVTIQREVELDAAGSVVDLGTDVTLWSLGETIAYGPSVGDAPPRDDTGTDNDGCADDRYESDDDVPLEPGMHWGLMLCGGGDTDRYVVDVEPGGQLNVYLRFQHQISDLDMRVFGPEGEEVTRSAGVANDEQAELVSENGGEHVVEIYRYGDGETCGYTLELELL